VNEAGSLNLPARFGVKYYYVGAAFDGINSHPIGCVSNRVETRLIEPQLLDCGIDMRRGDSKVHPVKHGQLLFERGDDAGQSRAIRR